MFLQDPRILIVDDEADLAEAIAQTLKLGGAETMVANDGNAGLIAVNKFDPDLIISDLRMPFLRGDQMLEELRKKGFKKPVIFMTGFGEMSSAVQALRNDALDFLSKPVPKEILVATVQKALRLEHQRLAQESETAQLYDLLSKHYNDNDTEWKKQIKEKAINSVKERRKKA